MFWLDATFQYLKFFVGSYHIYESHQLWDLQYYSHRLHGNRFGILKSQICMVGDRLDTDILFGQNGGCKTLLVLSGN